MTFVRLLVLDSDVVGWGECRSVEERIVVYIIIIMIARGARVRLQQCEYIIICARTARVMCEWCNVLTTRDVREDRKRKKNYYYLSIYEFQTENMRVQYILYGIPVKTVVAESVLLQVGGIMQICGSLITACGARCHRFTMRLAEKRKTF